MLQKSVGFELVSSTWPKHMKPPLAFVNLQASSPLSVKIADVLCELAVRTAPPVSQGFGLADCWAWQRYSQALDPSVDLRLRPEWNDLDAHQKTILSDDWGMGLTMHVLGDALKFGRVTSTTYFLEQTPGAAKFVHKSKRGPSKAPDFIAVDQAGKFHIIECKGTQSSPDVLAKQVDGGRPQKMNVRFGKHIPKGERLVAGCYIPQHSSPYHATMVVRDPPAKKDAYVVELSADEAEEIVARGELASVLHAVQLPTLGNRVALGERAGAAADYSVARELKLLTHDEQSGRRTKRAKLPFAFLSEGERVSRVVDVEIGISDAAVDAALDPRIALHERLPRHPWTRVDTDTGTRVASNSSGFFFSILFS
jgi:hypothetical protein